MEYHLAFHAACSSMHAASSHILLPYPTIMSMQQRVSLPKQAPPLQQQHSYRDEQLTDDTAHGGRLRII
jgi:hypothetical protein